MSRTSGMPAAERRTAGTGGAPSADRRDRGPHRVAALGFDGMAPFELGVVAEVFALPRPELGPSWDYAFALCAETPGPLRAVGGFAIEAPHGLDVLAAADTVVALGVADVHAGPPPAVLDAFRAAHARGARLVSICSGAFVLAAAGVLDGRAAATHWRYADALAARFPRIDVRPDVLYVDGGDVLTSAGTAAGIDLCLHLVRRDHGAAVANQVARRMVVAPHRDGGQRQFVEAPVVAAPAGDPVAAAMAHVLQHLDAPLSVGALARHAHVSERTLTRRFEAVTGTSPARWVTRQRIAAALPLLEAGEAVEAVGDRVGIPDPAAFRRQFRRAMGVAPSAWRQAFAAPGVSASSSRATALSTSSSSVRTVSSGSSGAS